MREWLTWGANERADVEFAMDKYRQRISRWLFNAVDWFIPAKIETNAEIIQGARMFLFSHLFGPFLGHTISLYILFIHGPDTAWWMFFWAITAFWPFPLVLKVTGWYVPLALVSIQNLIFCILWGCYQYGGISSPIMPWLITVPLLGFFYLPTRKTRIMVSCLIVINIAAVNFINVRYGFNNGTIPLRELSGLGMVSTFCAGIYVSMMALYYANIVSSQSELEAEIRRHLATTHQLRVATEEAGRASRAKSEFLAKMSHELRTPLSAILGYSEMLMEELDDSDPKTKDLRRIHDGGKTLVELINDLLDLSKLEAQKTDLHVEEFDLAELLASIAMDWERPTAESDVEFRVNHAEALGTVVNDAQKLRRVIDNLMSNAVKFAKGGRVTLTASNDGRQIVIAVADTGRGISPERMTTILDSFGNDPSETSSKYGDRPGLGLALSHRFCRLMGGDLSVESEMGRGSCFTIRVQARLALSSAINALQEAPHNTAHNIGGSENTILVIDDDPSALDLIERILSKEAILPVLCRSVAEGIVRARECMPAAIILDVRMQQPDGWEALRLIREDRQLRSTKVILLTVDDDFVKGRALGADAHLLKPIDRDALIRCIGSFCPALRTAHKSEAKLPLAAAV
jgi:signal transduction histidine kinase/ActR/RegA family two-component response regulator